MDGPVDLEELVWLRHYLRTEFDLGLTPDDELTLTGNRLYPYIPEALRGNAWDQEEEWEDEGFLLGVADDDGYNSDQSGIQDFLDGDEFRNSRNSCRLFEGQWPKS